MVPTLLVFGILPRIKLIPKELRSNLDRIKATYDARKETEVISNKTKLRTGLNSDVPGAADFEVIVGEEVIMFRGKPIGKWVRPYLVKEKD